MLRLRPFELLRPATLEEASALMRAHPDAVVLAGGTDLLPRMKLDRMRPSHVITLSGLGMERLEVEDDVLVIGARVTLETAATSALIRQRCPAVAKAAGHVASPQLRRMGTVGGNLCQDTRCRYINPSPLWRNALGGCLKSDGDRCHVVPKGRRCVAALCSDLAPVLIAHDATATLSGRTVDVKKLYGPDGVDPLTLEPGELLVDVRVPALPPGTVVAYRRWAVRKAIDYPLISLAVRLDGVGDDLMGGKIVVGVLGPRPKVLSLDRFAGQRMDEALAKRIGDWATTKVVPLENVPYDAAYRRRRVGVEIARAIIEETT